MDIMLAELRDQLPVDAVYLALHGAMAVRDVPRPEAEVARRFREVVGPDIPIAGTFDLHGNEDGEFLEHADFAFVTKRFPHYDAYIHGERAARALRLAARGEYQATTATRKPGIITATVLQWTGQSPSMDIMERARRWESREDDAYVSVFFGFPWSDVPDVGATVHVMTNGDQALADEIADDMDDFIWRVREDFALGGYPGPEEAAAIVADAIAQGEVPVAVGDYSDRPGDATHILKAFEAAGIGRVLYGTITSPVALRRWRTPAQGRRRLRMEIAVHAIRGAPHRFGRNTVSGGRLQLRSDRRGLVRRRQPGLPHPGVRTGALPGRLPLRRHRPGRLRGVRGEVAGALPPRLRRDRLRAHHRAGTGAGALRGDHLPGRAPLRARRPERAVSLRSAGQPQVSTAPRDRSSAASTYSPAGS